MRLSRFAISVMIVALLCVGCASGNGSKTVSRESDYQKMLELQKQKQALTMEEQIPKEMPSDPTAESYERMGDSYARQGNAAMAAVQYGKSLKLDPKRTVVHYKVGNLCLAKGMTDEAISEFDEVLKREPENGLGYQGKGLALLKKGDVTEAKRNLARAVDLKPELWQAHVALGTIYDREKRFPDAIDEYHKAIAVNPNSTSAFNNLGMSYFLSGDYERSLEAFKQAMRLDPSNGRVSNNVGVVLFKMGKETEALKYLTTANDQASAYNNLGYLYMSEGKYQEATDAFDRAIRTKPQYYEKAQENLQRARAMAEKAAGP
jgi:Flp pilus assembly protein TadD